MSDERVHPSQWSAWEWQQYNDRKEREREEPVTVDDGHTSAVPLTRDEAMKAFYALMREYNVDPGSALQAWNAIRDRPGVVRDALGMTEKTELGKQGYSAKGDVLVAAELAALLWEPVERTVWCGEWRRVETT